jgi:hypothetical protein
MATKKRPRRDAPKAKNSIVRPGRKPDNLSAADAGQFRAWLGRVRERWEAQGRSWIGTLLERAPCRKRSDGSTEEELPERDRDWFMRAQNTELPLSRKKAIEICLRLWRHRITKVNDNIVRMLIDTTDDRLVIVPPGEAQLLANHLVEGLENRANPINEAGRRFLDEYFARFESLTRRDAGLRGAVYRFQSEHRVVSWWALSRSKDFGEGEQFNALTLFMRLELETRDMKFDVRSGSRNRSK